MKNSILKLLIVTMSLMTSFFALAQMAPTNLAATVVDGNDVNLTWDAPVLLSEIAYDDGDTDGGYQPSYDQYMAVRMTMPEDGNLQEVALHLKSPFGTHDLNDIMVCPDDGSGLPDLTAPYESFGIISIDNSSWEWHFFSLTTPISLLSGVDFWVVAHWPSDLVFPYGIFVGADDTNPPVEDRNYFTSSSGAWVLLDEDNLMMRAYYSSSKNHNSEIGVSENTTEITSLKASNNTKSVNDLLGYNIYRNTVLIQYVTTNTYIDTDRPDGTYDYYTIAIYDTGESDPSNTVSVTINTAGIEESFIHNTIVYPNPATDIVNIKSDLQISSISVYSLTGQIVAKEFVENNSYQYNTSDLKSGFYIFRTETAKGTINHSVIIE